MERRNKLRSGARLSLFATSYFPLFSIMLIRQLSKYSDYLHWGGLNKPAIHNYLKYFGFTTVIGLFMLFGAIGLYFFVVKVGSSAKLSGTKVKIKDVKNRNSDAINYIATYLIPFLFQEYTAFPDILSIIILLVVMYFIYTNSSLLLINPTLNLFYSLYEVDYVDNFEETGKRKNGLIITKERFLEEDDYLLLKPIGHKLYFGSSIRG